MTSGVSALLTSVGPGVRSGAEPSTTAVTEPTWPRATRRTTSVRSPGPPTAAVWTPGAVVMAVSSSGDPSATTPAARHCHTCCTVASEIGLARKVTVPAWTCTTDRTCRSVGVTGTPSTTSRRAPSRSAHVTSRPSGSSAGTPGTISTQSRSLSCERRSVRPVEASASRTSSVRWSRDCTVTSSRSGLTQRTSTRYGIACRSQVTSTRVPSRRRTNRDERVVGAGGGVGDLGRLPVRVCGVADVPPLHRRGVDAGGRDRLTVGAPPVAARSAHLLRGDELAEPHDTSGSSSTASSRDEPSSSASRKAGPLT